MIEYSFELEHLVWWLGGGIAFMALLVVPFTRRKQNAAELRQVGARDTRWGRDQGDSESADPVMEDTDSVAELSVAELNPDDPLDFDSGPQVELQLTATDSNKIASVFQLEPVEDIELAMPDSSRSAGLRLQPLEDSASGREFDLGAEAFNVDVEGSQAALGNDSAQAKLDLAQAYLEIGDNDSARKLAEEVRSQGNGHESRQAGDLISKLSG